MLFSFPLRHSDRAVAKYPGDSLLCKRSAALFALAGILAVTTLEMGRAQTEERASASNGGGRSTAVEPLLTSGRRRPYKSRELRELVRNARTPEDHEQLAAYFRMREGEFRAKETYQQ